MCNNNYISRSNILNNHLSIILLIEVIILSKGQCGHSSIGAHVLFVLYPNTTFWGACLVQPEEHVTLSLEFLSLSPTLGIEVTYENKQKLKKKIYIYIYITS